MPETTGIRSHEGSRSHGGSYERVDASDPDAVTRRVHEASDGLTLLLGEAAQARRQRAEVAAAGSGGSPAVCAWNHFENIPTFYNWNNRPR